MRWSSRRILSIVAVVALVSLALTSAAVAGNGGGHHSKQIRRLVHVAKVERRVAIKEKHVATKEIAIAKHLRRKRIVRHRLRRTFAPTSITRAAEVSAVVLDPVTQQFMQVTFDRGTVTAVSSGSITLEQRQNNALWRTQTFTVPSTAVVTLNGRAVSLTQIPTGARTRIESSGSVGGTQSVVRVNAYSGGREAPMPSTSSS